MRLRLLSLSIILVFVTEMSAQRANPFHTLNMPSASPQVIEMQKLGVTEIEINYHSPALNNRDVWNNPGVIAQNGDPIPWRAGANMNTTISFSTDVLIEGEALSAGTYGFHIIPSGNEYRLLFAHSNDQWGSYYLDIEKDVTLSVNVSGVNCTASERLDYEFLDRTDSTVVIGLEWADKRIPFTVSVDLKNTTLASLRSELKGINTYRWQAWNDAASWCLRRETNLEEAIVWAQRSIDGGYNGFGANKNLANLTTKASLLSKLGRGNELNTTINEAHEIGGTSSEINYFSIFLIRQGKFEDALKMSASSLKENPNTWYLQLNHGVSSYFLGREKDAISMLNMSLENTPEPYKQYVVKVLDDVKNGTYKL